jgi:hypothetical protein
MISPSETPSASRASTKRPPILRAQLEARFAGNAPPVALDGSRLDLRRLAGEAELLAAGQAGAFAPLLGE